MLIAIFLTGVGFYGINNINKLSNKMKFLTDHIFIAIRSLEDTQKMNNLTRVTLANLYFAKTNAERELFLQLSREQLDKVGETLTVYSGFLENDIDIKNLNNVKTALINYTKLYEQAIQFIYTGEDAQYKALAVDNLPKSASAVEAAIKLIIDEHYEEAAQISIDGKKLFTLSRNITISIIIVSLLFCVALGFFIAQVISLPLIRMVDLVGKIAKGDLRETIEIDTKDEVGQLARSINSMVTSLRGTVSGILATVNQVTSSSQQISATTDEMAKGNYSQAIAAQTMSKLFQELSLAINSVAINAEEASDISYKTMEIAREGGEVVRSSIDGMDLVNLQILRLAEDSNKIGDIVEVINEIAGQTNLLALNAAIEAARAGEHGKGFAVVAVEVRKLAERSREATKQITGIIKGIQTNTEQSVKVVGEGVITSQKTGKAFENIINMVNQSAHKVSEIAVASEQQFAQSSEVLISIESISAITEESAAGSEETAATAQSLASLADNLYKAVAIFKIR